jgi:acyl-CoA synthetase (AMP-forming)/AMP-acid ligase II
VTAAGTILEVYERLAARGSSSPAVVYARPPHDGVVLTWGGLLERATEIAGELCSAGLEPAGRCAVVMVDHPDVLPAVLAVWRAGGVVVPVDSEWGSGTRGSVLGMSRADVVADPRQGAWDRVVGAQAPGPGLPPGTAMISYTSGSTSDPKGVMLTHGQLLHAYTSSSAALGEMLGRVPTRFGASMRLSGLGILGMNYLWPAVMAMPVVVLPALSLGTAGRYFSGLREHGVELTYLVPPLVELLNRAGSVRDADGSAVTCLSGGAPLAKAALESFQDRFGAVLLNVYGLTEVSFAAFFGDLGDDGRGTSSIGAPVTVEARLRDADGRVVTGPGEGELELSGPARSCGYYDNPAANEAVLTPDGWLRSGDLARRDGAGRYWIVGRRKNVVLKGGFTVYLHEVEEVAAGLAGVLESAAVRIDLPTGEDVGLLVRAIPDAELVASDVQAELAERLGCQRSPRRVIVVSEPLPRVAQEKIDRPAAGLLWNRLASTNE